MRQVAVLLASLSAALAAVPAAAPATQAPTVESWLRFELDAIASNRANPPRAARALALVSRSMFEASERGGSGREEAVAGAASTTLAYLFPGEAARQKSSQARRVRCARRRSPRARASRSS